MKIGIVNDGLVIAEALRRVVVNTPEHQVAWVAHSGEQAVQFCEDNRPDLVLMDLIMPGMDGVEATRLIMQQSPCAILIVTASPEDNTPMVFRALGAGALDVVATPVLAGHSASDSALLAKIRTIGKLIAADTPGTGSPPRRRTASPAGQRDVETLVAIGASTGGPMAIAKLFSQWKPGPGVAAIIVQHIDQAFTDSFSRWLAGQIDHPVDVIEEGTTPIPGRIMVAKTNDHLVLDEKHRMRYVAEPLSYPYRPSVNVFFECIAQNWQRKAVGVLLTGMGRDGASGLLAMRRAGKSTIAQDQGSSAVYGMPRAAAELGAAERILPLEKIGAQLGALVSRHSV